MTSGRASRSNRFRKRARIDGNAGASAVAKSTIAASTASGRDAEPASMFADANGTRVSLAAHALHARNGPCCQKTQHGFPVERRPVRQGQPQGIGLNRLAAEPPQGTGRQPIMAAKEGIEPAHALEPGRKCDLHHRQLCLGNQPLGQEQAIRLSKFDRRHA